MSIFMDRSRRAGRFLEWKVRVFVVGATLALGGIYLNRPWVVGLAIAVLAVGMALRFFPDGEEAGEVAEETETNASEEESDGGNDA